MTETSEYSETSFGRMLTVGFGGTTVELLEFQEEGYHHTHERWEHAVCLQGEGRMEWGETRIPATANDAFSVPPGVPHRMVPAPDSEEAFRWVVWYSDGPVGEIMQGIPPEQLGPDGYGGPEEER